jgi:hypothetical protein
MGGALRFHVERVHRYYVGDLRNGRALMTAHAQMHTVEWANPDATPHAHLDVPTFQLVEMGVPSTEGSST